MRLFRLRGFSKHIAKEISKRHCTEWRKHKLFVEKGLVSKVHKEFSNTPTTNISVKEIHVLNKSFSKEDIKMVNGIWKYSKYY